jgi:hypothetical protein
MIFMFCLLKETTLKTYHYVFQYFKLLILYIKFLHLTYLTKIRRKVICGNTFAYTFIAANR